MTLSLIPETAPFNPEQRAWLNGFLAGWLGLQDADGIAVASPNAPPEASAPAADDHPWHDPALSLDERLTLAEGRPLPQRLMAAMAQLDCGACGYVCKTYAEAIASGAESSLSLCAPGGSETSRALKRLLKEAPAAPAAAKGEASVNSTICSRQNPYTATLLRSVRLNREGSEKAVYHVEIDLGDSGLSYKVGDALGIYPTNCEELVDVLLAELTPSGCEPAVRESLVRDRCLAEITEECLALLADAAADADEAAGLRGMLDGDGPESGMDALDLLRRFPSARPAPADFAATLARLKPRLYSISSSPRKHAGQVHLTVGRVGSTIGGRERKGVASTMLADRVRPGGPLRVFVQSSHGFTLPDDPAAPVIMIGPGTGIAPFRAFLHERDALGATGKNWLFFGDQRSAFDFLYEDELTDLSARGVLNRLDLAFSRDGGRKLYVQHRILEHGAGVYTWLQEGASVFVCGDARRMAPDVDRALREVLRRHGGLDDGAAAAELSRLAAAGRYRRDVY
jgi:sulfite reductase (NADPH) flavoprotein alpha-component